MSGEERGGEAVQRSGIQSEVAVESHAYAAASRRRFEATLRRIDSIAAPALDLGPANALARELEQRLGTPLENTGQHDLDRERLRSFRPGPYATITGFEILEHLLNPLFLLDGCREVLQPEGVLYLSVPRRSPWEWLFGKSPEHFHEFATDELLWVVEKAGFKVERYETFNTTPLSLGVRPLLRRLLHNLMFVRCRLTQGG